MGDQERGGPGTLTFTVPGDPLQLSPNKRLHPFVRRRLKNEWRAKGWVAWADAGRVRFDVKVRITFTLRRGRSADCDNAAASMKALSDSFVDEPGRPGMLVDDGPDYVEYGPIRQESGKQWRERPEVVVFVEAV